MISDNNYKFVGQRRNYNKLQYYLLVERAERREEIVPHNEHYDDDDDDDDAIKRYCRQQTTTATTSTAIWALFDPKVYGLSTVGLLWLHCSTTKPRATRSATNHDPSDIAEADKTGGCGSKRVH